MPQVTTIEELLAGEVTIQDDTSSDNTTQVNPEIIRFQVGDIVVGRFLPYLPDKDKTKVEFTETGINSQLNNQYIRCGRMRRLEGLKDPFMDLKKKVWVKYEETKDEAYRNFYSNCFQVSPKVLFNWFTISHKNDTVADFEEEENTNRVLRLPANRNWKTREITSHVFNQWHDAYFGEGPDDEDKLGNAIFNLGKEGYSYKVKIVDKGGYINYDQSGFELKPKAIKGLTGDDWREPYSNTFDLEQYVPLIMSEEEVNEILNTHLEEVVLAVNNNRTVSLGSSKVDDDNIPLDDDNDTDVDAEDDESIKATIQAFRQKKENSEPAGK